MTIPFTEENYFLTQLEDVKCGGCPPNSLNIFINETRYYPQERHTIMKTPDRTRYIYHTSLVLKELDITDKLFEFIPIIDEYDLANTGCNHC